MVSVYIAGRCCIPVLLIVHSKIHASPCHHMHALLYHFSTHAGTTAACNCLTGFDIFAQTSDSSSDESGGSHKVVISFTNGLKITWITLP